MATSDYELPSFNYQPLPPRIMDLLQQARMAKGQEAVPNSVGAVGTPVSPASIDVPPAVVPPSPAAQQALAPAAPTPAAEQKSGESGKAEKPVLPEAASNARKVLDALYTKEGGILGTGISVAQAMLFGLGALGTRKVPSAQAWQTSLKLMMLPQEIEQAKQKAMLETLQMQLLGKKIEPEIDELKASAAREKAQ